METPPPSPADDLAIYAALAAALADPAADRRAILAARNLDEAGWDAIEDLWQARLDESTDAHGDVEGIPALVAAHAEALAHAHAARGRGAAAISFEHFAAVARALARGEDAHALLARMGATLDEYLAAQKHWTERMIEDDALAARFDEELG
jgi:hypothetical protein